MRVALAGACPVVDRCGPTLVAAGHEVVLLRRSPDARARSRRPDGRPDGGADAALVSALDGCDALVNLDTGALGEQDGRAADLVVAARAAGVRRFVQRSVSLMYADQGPDWITERSPLCVTSLTEASSMDEVAVQTFVSPCRDGVVLRMGLVLGDPASTRTWLRAVATRRTTAGRDDGFSHVLHVDDVAPAVHAALDAPSGIYNVGAAPVRRTDVLESCLSSFGRRALWHGRRLEPMTRSLRVSSSAFMGTTGWAPRRDEFDASWIEAAVAPPFALR